MLLDEAVISVKDGDGGNGAVAFYSMKGGPAGGHGGRGGSVYFIGVDDIDSLSKF